MDIETDSAMYDFDSSDFETVLSTTYYVDKTLLIKSLLEEKSTKILITAPRRFGKSTNLNMIKRFLEIEMNEEGERKSKANYKREPVRDTPAYDLFVENTLKIIQHPEIMDEHFGRHPVVYADFKRDSFVRSFDDAAQFCRRVVGKSYQEHKYLQNSKKLTNLDKEYCKSWCEEKNMCANDVIGGLRQLTYYLWKHFNKKKVFVLIDNCDSLVAKAVFQIKEESELRDIIEFNKNMMATVARHYDVYVDRIFVNGVSFMICEYLLMLNDIESCRFLGNHAFVKFYGLTPEETNVLFQTSLLLFYRPNMNQNALERYNAYTTANGTKIHNMWSILHYVKYKKIEDYWRKSVMIKNFYKMLENPWIKVRIERLIQRRAIDIVVPENISLQQIIDLRDFILEPKTKDTFYHLSLFFLFLLEQGYLSYHRSEETNLPSDHVLLEIPNEEISEEFFEKLTHYYVTVLLSRLLR